ncbi:hypothetical protein C8R46DRAFT_461585 [Mycena filopes]|nr:hypothetical protein C8R46DRAFT_461585 [Mycena filopes]
MTSICKTCGALRTESRPSSALPLASAIPPPELPSLLANNDPPPDSEIPRILAVISAGQDRIDALDPQIRALQARLASLTQARDEAVKHVREYRAIVSPLRQLPPEVLGEIFALSIGASGDSERGEPPWYLGHICRSWRSIALTYPRLWTHLTIREDLPRVEAQLHRAGNALLDVYWSGAQNERNPGLADLMAPHYARWRTLHIESYELAGGDMPEWLRLASSHLAQLTTLEITDTEEVKIPDFLSAAPNLRRVLLTDLDFTQSSALTPIPWGQNTHYRGTFSPQRQIEILKAAQNLLVVCSVGFIRHIFDLPLAPLVTLPRLRRLNTESARFLPYLTAPALQELTCSYTQPEAMPLLLSFISTSCCTLTTLALFRCALDTAFLPVLQAVPSLIHLFIDCDDIYTELQTIVFSAMTHSTPPFLCPSLTSLVYVYRMPNMAPEEEFFAMARSAHAADRSTAWNVSVSSNSINFPHPKAS